jgi:hypothetical protein
MSQTRTSRRRLFAASALLLAPALNLAAPASAQPADGVRVLRSAFESRFPGSMVFQLEATVARPVERVTLNFRIADRRTLVAGDARFSQSGMLRAEHAVDLARRYLPPGTALEFYWQIEDDRGQRFRSQSYQAVLEDRRFTWRQLRAPNLELYWYRGDDTYGRVLLSIAGRALGQVAGESGVTLDRAVKIFVYAEMEEFRSASYRGGYEWVGGTFYPLEGVILILAPPNQQGAEIARRAIPHELTHAVVHQVTDNPFGDVPQWLNEGMASRSEPGFSSDQAEALARALADDKLMSLRAISGSFPVDSDEALLAYGESYSAVTFLLEQYGRGGLNQLLQAYREGVTHDEGLQRALGVDMAEFDRQWRAWLAPSALQKTTPPADLPQPAAAPTPVPPTQGLMEWVKRQADSIWGRREPR